MKIFIDIGHPGQVHYFKNAIKLLKLHNHEIMITVRDREFVKELLIDLNLPFNNRGKGKDSFLGKILYMFKADFILYKKAIRFKPDLFLSFASPYAAQVAFLMGKPHIALTDTEHEDKVNSVLVFPFSSCILTPNSYLNNLGSKHLRFKNVVEGFYLHKKYFKRDVNIKKILKIKPEENFVLLRFVSWNAHHDYKQSGLNLETKSKLIGLLETKYKVFISSEAELPEPLKKYKIMIPPEKMHDVLASSSIFIGESATMASESTLLGTHAVYINSLPLMGYLELEQEHGLLKHFESSTGVLEYVKELLGVENLKKSSFEKSVKMQESFIDSTEFLVWFIENFPDSLKTLKDNPEYQLKFK